jgi:hypothetical protein
VTDREPYDLTPYEPLAWPPAPLRFLWRRQPPKVGGGPLTRHWLAAEQFAGLTAGVDLGGAHAIYRYYETREAALADLGG